MGKYISEFVKRQKAIDARAKASVVTLWNSSLYGTYVRSKHGALLNGKELKPVNNKPRQK